MHGSLVGTMGNPESHTPIARADQLGTPIKAYAKIWDRWSPQFPKTESAES
jgi:hypothetical protein